MRHWHQFLDWVHAIRGVTHIGVALLAYHAHKARTWNRERKLKLAVLKFKTSTPTGPVDAATAASNLANDIETIVGDVAKAADQITKANLWTAIIGFFTALPGIIVLVQEFWTWAQTVSGGNPGTLISNFGSAMGDLTNAETEAERAAALQNLSDLFPKLH